MPSARSARSVYSPCAGTSTGTSSGAWQPPRTVATVSRTVAVRGWAASLKTCRGRPSPPAGTKHRATGAHARRIPYHAAVGRPVTSSTPHPAPGAVDIAESTRAPRHADVAARHCAKVRWNTWARAARSRSSRAPWSAGAPCGAGRAGRARPASGSLSRSRKSRWTYSRVVSSNVHPAPGSWATPCRHAWAESAPSNGASVPNCARTTAGSGGTANARDSAAKRTPRVTASSTGRPYAPTPK